jgi:D-serine deaminase-like pyridoxal phosphate-dependent protein
MKAAKAWYQINNIEEIDSPAFVIYKERVQHNIALAIKMIGDVSRLRPHVKTHKSEEVTALMMKAGITKFKCATIAEAEMLGRCGAADVLLTYQTVGPKLNRFIALIKAFPATHFSCLVDNEGAAKAIADAARVNGIIVPVFIDVNIGMNRTGILLRDSLQLYETCKLLKEINMMGVHGYDGHINDTDVSLRTQRADEAFEKLNTVKDKLVAAGLNSSVVVIGGSPTFSIHVLRKGVECSAGTFVYWDASYSETFPDLLFLPAALVISRVVSVLNTTTICLDLGHKSIAAENPINRRVKFLNVPEVKFISQSEEHLVIELPAGHGMKPGDVLYGMPIHVCPTCALYDTALIIENGNMREQWQMIARQRKITI